MVSYSKDLSIEKLRFKILNHKSRIPVKQGDIYNRGIILGFILGFIAGIEIFVIVCV